MVDMDQKSINCFDEIPVSLRKGNRKVGHCSILVLKPEYVFPMYIDIKYLAVICESIKFFLLCHHLNFYSTKACYSNPPMAKKGRGVATLPNRFF